MILIHGEARLMDGARDAMVAAAAPMIEASLAEDGCHAYRYSFDVADPGLMYFHEEWESDEALMAHFQTPHLAAFVTATGELMDGPVTILRSTISDTAPLGG